MNKQKKISNRSTDSRNFQTICLQSITQISIQKTSDFPTTSNSTNLDIANAVTDAGSVLSAREKAVCIVNLWRRTSRLLHSIQNARIAHHFSEEARILTFTFMVYNPQVIDSLISLKEMNIEQKIGQKKQHEIFT